MVVTTTSPDDFNILIRIGLEIPSSSFSNDKLFVCDQLDVKDFLSRKYRYQDKELVLAISVYSQLLEKYNYPVKDKFIQLLQLQSVRELFVIKERERKKELHVVQLLFVKFLFDHKCNRPDCEEYTYLKCGECRDAHYCSKFCQVKSWLPKHHQFCGERKISRSMEELTYSMIKRITHNALKKEIVTFKAAFKRIMMLTFTLNAKNDALVKRCSDFFANFKYINYHDKKYLELLETLD